MALPLASTPLSPDSRAARCFLLLALLMSTGVASADHPPTAGAVLPPVRVEPVDGAARTLPDPHKAVLVVYEDRDAGPQNAHVKPLLDRVARAHNRDKVEVVPVGDVSAFDFWPAKRFVRDHIRKQQHRDGTTIWLDWKGAVQQHWRLTKGKSGILLVDLSGAARFVGEGPLSKAQIAQLEARLVELGCDLH